MSQSKEAKAKDLSGKVALITGSAKRIGKAIALSLAERGANIAVHYNASEKEAEELVSQLHDLDVRAEAFCYDLSFVDNARLLVNDAAKVFKRLDIVINNASNFPSPNQRRGKFDIFNESEDTWAASINVNARAPFFTIKHAAKFLAKSDNGVIINMLDSSATIPFVTRAAHSVSKAALAAINTLAAKTLYPDVRVNALELGAILPPEELSKNQQGHVKWGSVEDVCKAINFIIDSPFLNGQIIQLDGGELLKRDSID